METDVFVVGMGFAGLACALAASAAGARVVLADKEGPADAGGNSRICSQGFLAGRPGCDPEGVLGYMRALSGMAPGADPVLDAVVGRFSREVSCLQGTVASRYGLDSRDFRAWDGHARMGFISPEYPEMPGAAAVSLVSAHAGMRDGYLYKVLRARVAEQAEKGRVSMVFGARAVGLARDCGGWAVELESPDGAPSRVCARSVCLCTGGFAASTDLCAHYLGLESCATIGSPSSTGDGILLARQAGASLWHMEAYEGGFGFASMGFDLGDKVANVSPMFASAANSGALVAVGRDGRRFCDEASVSRHGHVLRGRGAWGNPAYPKGGIWAVYDARQWELALASLKDDVAAAARGVSVRASCPHELATLLGVDAEGLQETLAEFGDQAMQGAYDPFGRDPATKRAFDDGPLAAVPLRPLVLNTQGGPRRDADGRVLGCGGDPLPGLFGAGELGGLTSARYQAGTNVAECLLSGHWAGTSAAQHARSTGRQAAAGR